VDPQGNVWVTDVGNNRVLRFSHRIRRQLTSCSGQSGFTSVGETQPSVTTVLQARVSILLGPRWCGTILLPIKSSSLIGALEIRCVSDPNAPVFGDFPRSHSTISPFASGMSASEVLVGSDFGTINTSVQRWRRPTGPRFLKPGQLEFVLV